MTTPVESPRTGAEDLDDRCRRAAKIFVTDETKRDYPNGYDAICAPPIAPSLPTTRGEATPHILLAGPFQDEPDLIAVAIYIGIGFIEVRDLDRVRCSYELCAIDGNGIDTRDAYLQAAFRLYFNDVQLQTKDLS